MLTEMISLIARTGIWRTAGHTELPLLSREANPVSNQLLVVAGGLALALSRCAAEDHAKLYPRAAQLYTLLRRELKIHGRTSASSSLILEAFHETSEILDPNTRRAFQKCLEARSQFDRAKALQREPVRSPEAAYTSFMPMSEDAPTSAPHSSVKRSSAPS